MILLILSFVAGILTILAPCTLPLLPVIIGSSVADNGAVGADGKPQGNMKKALTIALSLGASVVLFTLLLKVSSLLINIPQTVWSVVSGVIILIFGLVSLFPELWEKIPLVAKMNTESNKLLGVGYKRKGLLGNIIIGASLGPVFSTCSPTYFVILATVLPQSFFLGLVDLLAYAVGLSGVLLLVAFVGQKLVSRLGGISDTHGWFKRTLGMLFIIIGIGIMFGVDKTLETNLLNSGIFDITQVEQKLLQLNDSSSIGNSLSIPNGDDTLASGDLSALGSTTAAEGTSTASGGAKTGHKVIPGIPEPEITKPSGFINTGGQPITLSQFKGKKVMLVDFWTYSCINCQRTLPYLKAWYAKYKDQGLEIVSIHTPEFAFEKVQSNVEDAVKRLGIEYPVVMDNDYATWNAFHNQYWPRKYLISVDGNIIYDHIGEGNYDETERAIQMALLDLNMEKGTSAVIPTTIAKPTDAISMDDTKVASPETYFGATRNQYLANGQAGKTGPQTLYLPADTSTIQLNQLYLQGRWNFQAESATNEEMIGTNVSTDAIKRGEAKIVYKYSAKNVYMVASSDLPQGISVDILVDGKLKKTITIKDNKLYTLVEGTDYGTHTLEIDIPAAGLNAFTFTFG